MNESSCLNQTAAPKRCCVILQPESSRGTNQVEPKTHGDRDRRPPSKIRFGPFVLDIRAAELRKEGLKIRVQDQPFQILRMLLDRPGEVGLRDEIRDKLWAAGQVVE